MKVGFQTIVWGPFFERLEYALDVIAGSGYEGVEFMQRLGTLPDVHPLLDLLAVRQGLKLIGLAGDTLDKRMTFCQDYRPEYLYVDYWSEQEALDAMQRGFTLGLHPHVYMEIQSFEDANKVLEAHPKDNYPMLKFIPDTAHLTIARDDPLNVIEHTLDRTVAIHLKDWTPEFGHSPRLYAKGFVPLGRGCVDLNAILDYLTSVKYDGWVVVEVDYTRTNPAQTTLDSARWLADKGLLKRIPREVKDDRVIGIPVLDHERQWAVIRENRFLQKLSRANIQDLSSCYSSIVEALEDLTDCDLAQLWICNPRDQVMSLLAMKTKHALSLPMPPIAVFSKFKDLLSGEAVVRQTPVESDLADPDKVSACGCSQLVEILGLKKIVAIPIPSPWNPRHIRLVANVFFRDNGEHLENEKLTQLVEHVAIAMESAMGDLCSYAAARVNFLAGNSKHLSDFLPRLLDAIGKLVASEGAAIFLANNTGDRLEQKATTGTLWNVSEGERFYVKGEGLTGRVWEKGRTFITPKAWFESDSVNKSVEGSPSRSNPTALTSRSKDHHPVRKNACLFVPLVKLTGEVVGVIRCRNKHPQQTPQASTSFVFSDDDAEILEAVAQAAIPHIDLLLIHEHRVEALGKLTHELKTPIVAVRGAVDFIQNTPGVRDSLSHDYLGDILDWTNLMTQLLNSLDLVRATLLRLPIRCSLINLVPDVIAPAVKQMKPMVHARGFSPRKITWGRNISVPPLFLDRTRFYQVVFNLISNAIKYAYEDPNIFTVEIEGFKQSPWIIVKFRDWGIGIPKGEEDAIFREGIRGTSVVEQDVTGQGLGLWFIRETVEAHGGKVKVTNNRYPTEFTIWLPSRLEYGPPKQQGST